MGLLNSFWVTQSSISLLQTDAHEYVEHYSDVYLLCLCTNALLHNHNIVAVLSLPGLQICRRNQTKKTPETLFGQGDAVGCV